MNRYRADLHIHTVLSPCGDLDMSPVRIVEAASSQGLDIIGITDHNSTLHCELISKMASKQGIFVLMGAEITTKEEVHCLAFFERLDTLNEFQNYIDEALPATQNDPDTFGPQLVVDEDENILYEEKRLLISALNISLEQAEQKVHSLNGIFIPAHIDKSRFSILSQLGFIPFGLKAEAFEFWGKGNPENANIAGYDRVTPFIRSSDAHFIEQIGSKYSYFEMENRSFENIKNAFHTKGSISLVG